MRLAVWYLHYITAFQLPSSTSGHTLNGTSSSRLMLCPSAVVALSSARNVRCTRSPSTLAFSDSMRGGVLSTSKRGLVASPVKVSSEECDGASVATTAIAPMQDILGLGSEARMNLPGTSSGNWEWRMKPGAAASEIALKLRELVELYDR